MITKRFAWALPVAVVTLALGLPAHTSADVRELLATGHSLRPNIALIQPVTDLGPADPDQNVSLSVVLKTQNTAKLASFISATEAPSSSNYHKFLSVNQFRTLYAPPATTVNNLVRYFQQNGLQSYALADGLVVKAVGPASAFEKLFKLSIENFAVTGQTFYAASKPLTFPKTYAPYVLATIGLDNYAGLVPQWVTLAHGPDGTNTSTPVTLPKNGSANGIPGQFTVGDVANHYDVNGLYHKGMNGQGRTIGIATFANFHPQDAYQYWNAIHVKVKPNRIRQVFVDGGGPLGKDVGSGETALDVEQSGGLAPDANIVVYDSANSDQGFVDMFYQAASDNVIDTLSISWGAPELFYLASQATNELTALHQAFMEAAAQGISTFSATGDAGAYDVNAAVPFPFVSKVVSVDAPSSDPYVTATGGVTLAGSYKLKNGWVNVPETRAWGWDYMTDYMNSYYGPYGLYTNNVFPTGSGGGVSSVWKLPDYQSGMSAMQTTQAAHLFDFTQDPPVDFFDLRSGFAGRNTPDISLNADPYSGYLIYSKPDGGWVKNVGGTSLAAPQLNGMTVLMSQYVGSRLGLLNPALYTLAKSNAYGASQPLTDITAGGNWFYDAIPGYDQASGVGSPNITNLADWLKRQAAGNPATSAGGQ